MDSSLLQVLATGAVVSAFVLMIPLVLCGVFMLFTSQARWWF